MSNNNNKPQTAVNRPVEPVRVSETGESPVAVAEKNDPLRDAVKLCLSLLLRCAVYGGVNRSSEEEIKKAIKDLE
jgi:hypothetical protein